MNIVSFFRQVSLSLLVIAPLLPIRPVAASPQGNAFTFASLYKKSNSATSQNDVDGVFANCTSDCTFIAIDGKSEGLTTKKLLIGICLKEAPLSAKTTIDNVAIDGDLAVVSVTEVVSVTFQPAPNTDIEQYTNKCRDLWVLSNGVWKEKRSRMLSSTTPDARPSDTVGNFHW